MKTLFVLLLASVTLAQAQGTLNFANAGVGINAPVTFFDGTQSIKLSGPDWVADLYYGGGLVTEQWTLRPLNKPAVFLTGAQAGYFVGSRREIPGFGGGAIITAQVRVWRLSDGPTFEQAAWGSFGLVGWSGLFQVQLTVPPMVPPNLVGLQPFSVVVIPEPSGGLLLSLGLVAFGCFRRWGRPAA